MQRVSVKLSELEPNPFKKLIRGGELDDRVVAQIVESAERTSFWQQWVVRKTDSRYQLAFGHHRLAAAKKLLGLDARVDVQVEPYTDAQMYIAMADENAGDEESLANQVDVVQKAKNLLLSHPDWCKYHSVGNGPNESARVDGRGGKTHKHGSVGCICAFLGRNNWSHAKVCNLLQLAEKADSHLLTAASSGTDTRHPKPGQISREAAVALADLSFDAQLAAVEAIQKAELSIPADLIRDAVTEVEVLPPER